MSKMKILLVKRDKIGDLLLCTPIFSQLRASFPNAELHLLANDYNAWVAADEPTLDKIWVYPRTKTGGRVRWRAPFVELAINSNLRREHFDVAIVAQGEFSLRAVRRGIRARARRTIAFLDQGTHNSWRISDALAPPDRGHETARLFVLLEPLGIAMPTALPYPRFSLPTAADSFAAAWLAKHGLTTNEYVLLGMGSREVRRQPTADQIERWAKLLYWQRGLKTVFVWTPGRRDTGIYPGDDEVAAQVIAKGSHCIYPCRGGILEILGLIWHARATLIPDSGLMHFAAVSPGGVLGLFADEASAFEQWMPRGPKARALNAATSIAETPDEIVLSQFDQLLVPGQSGHSALPKADV